MKNMVEILTHFHCPSCKGWWTVGDQYLASKIFPKRYCPHCGKEQSDDCVARDQIAHLEQVIAILQQQVRVE